MKAFQPLLAASRLLLRSRINAAPSIINRTFHHSSSAQHARTLLLPCSILQSSLAVPFLSTSFPTIQSFSFSTRPPKNRNSTLIIEEQKRLSKTQDAIAILQLITDHISNFNGRQHSTILKGITNPNHLKRIRTHPVFLKFVKSTAEKIKSNDKTDFFHPIGLSMIAVSAAKIGRMAGTDEMFAAVSNQSSWIVNNCDSQAMANISTAYAKLEISNHQEYFAAVNDKDIALYIMENGTPQAIANIATAYSSLGVVDHANYFLALSDNMSVVNEGDS